MSIFTLFDTFYLSQRIEPTQLKRRAEFLQCFCHMRNTFPDGDESVKHIDSIPKFKNKTKQNKTKTKQKTKTKTKTNKNKNKNKNKTKQKIQQEQTNV